MRNTMDSLTVDQKFARVMLDLRILRPFYSAVYEVMEKIQREQVETMAVSIDKFYYSESFVDKLELDEMIFTVLHEIAHIALMHVTRRENREPMLWNLACDFYVNAILAKEFNLRYPNDTATHDSIKIKMPAGVLFCSTIDVDVDFAESLYDNLMRQAKQNGFMDALANGGGYSEDLDDRTFKFEMEGSQKEEGSNGYSMYGYDRTINNTYKKVSFDVKINDQYDLIDSGEDQSEKEQRANKIVADAAVRVDMSSSNIGKDKGTLEAMARKLLESKIDWKKLLKKYLISATATDSSFSRPDKRMYYHRAIYPGQIADEMNEIHGVKVCIDTSGSISDEELGIFMGQVWQLCNTFKVKAELIYWDAAIQSTGEFTGYKEFERVDIYGRGGTDPSVIFDYLDSKKCKIKPIVTLIFTDGYFDDKYNTPRNRKKYRDTIWVMSKEHNEDFEPLFGKKAVAKFDA